MANSTSGERATAGSASVKVTIEALEALLQTVASEARIEAGYRGQKTNPTSALARRSPRGDVPGRSHGQGLRDECDSRADRPARYRRRFSNARLSTPALDGDAMVTNLAGSFLRPRLQQLEGRVFPLLAFSPGGLKLRDIQVVTVTLHFAAFRAIWAKAEIRF